MNKNSKIYITGHSGMVGSAIHRNLKNNSYNNIIYENSKNLDLRNQENTKNYFLNNKPEYVFHSAAKVGGIVANNTYKAEFIYDNTTISTNVIHNAYLSNVKRLINLGSSCIYPKYANQPIKETELLTGALESTNEPYAIAKILALKMSEFYKSQYGCDFISLMPTNLYGPNDNYNLETSHVIPALLRKFILGKALQDDNIDFIRNDIEKRYLGYNITNTLNDTELIKKLKSIGISKNAIKIWGTGNIRREFLHVDDLADACLYFMNLSNTNNIDGFINIGTGLDIKLYDLAFFIKDLVGYKGNIKTDISKPDGTPQKLLDVNKAKDLGWTSKITLEHGLIQVYQQYLKN